MKINESKFAFFYLRLFFRIGTFQWVTADSSKKSSRPQTPMGPKHISVSFSRDQAFLSRPSVAEDRGSIRRVFDDIARISAFLNKLRTRLSPAAAARQARRGRRWSGAGVRLRPARDRQILVIATAGTGLAGRVSPRRMRPALTDHARLCMLKR
jgi:hypothetical protein